MSTPEEYDQIMTAYELSVIENDNKLEELKAALKAAPQETLKSPKPVPLIDFVKLESSDSSWISYFKNYFNA